MGKKFDDEADEDEDYPMPTLEEVLNEAPLPGDDEFAAMLKKVGVVLPPPED
jgi:hypothetical protein